MRNVRRKKALQQQLYSLMEAEDKLLDRWFILSRKGTKSEKLNNLLDALDDKIVQVADEFLQIYTKNGA